MEQGRRDLAAHPLAQGQHPGRGFEQIPQLQQVRQPVPVLPEGPLRGPVDVPQQQEGLHHRHVPPQLAALAEDHPQPGHVALPVRPGREAVHGAGAAVGPEDAAEDLDGGALAGPVGPDVAHDLSVRDGEGHLPQGWYVRAVLGEEASHRVSKAGLPPPDPVGLADSFHFDHCLLLLV